MPHPRSRSRGRPLPHFVPPRPEPARDFTFSPSLYSYLVAQPTIAMYAFSPRPARAEPARQSHFGTDAEVSAERLRGRRIADKLFSSESFCGRPQASSYPPFRGSLELDRNPRRVTTEPIPTARDRSRTERGLIGFFRRAPQGQKRTDARPRLIPSSRRTALLLRFRTRERSYLDRPVFNRFPRFRPRRGCGAGGKVGGRPATVFRERRSAASPTRGRISFSCEGSGRSADENDGASSLDVRRFRTPRGSRPEGGDAELGQFDALGTHPPSTRRRPPRTRAVDDVLGTARDRFPAACDPNGTGSFAARFARR